MLIRSAKWKVRIFLSIYQIIPNPKFIIIVFIKLVSQKTQFVFYSCFFFYYQKLYILHRYILWKYFVFCPTEKCLLPLEKPGLGPVAVHIRPLPRYSWIVIKTRPKNMIFIYTLFTPRWFQKKYFRVHKIIIILPIVCIIGLTIIY